MRALLDVNVLVALVDTDHLDHGRARAWLTAEIDDGWASCPITQNGFVRVLSQPAYPNAVSPADAMRRLAAATATTHHEFWPAAISVLDGRRIERRHVLGHRQVTDVYLLATAVDHGGRFVTFDRGLSAGAVPAATSEQLVVL